MSELNQLLLDFDYNIEFNNITFYYKKKQNLIFEKLNWKPQEKLADGLKKTFDWIKKEMRPSTSGSPNY